MDFTNIGRMKSRIDIYDLKITQDEYGDISKERVKIHSCWCDIKTQYLKDVKATVGTILENTINFVIRHDEKININNDMEIVHNNIIYQIVQIQSDIQFKRFDVLIAKRKA